MMIKKNQKPFGHCDRQNNAPPQRCSDPDPQKLWLCELHGKKLPTELRLLISWP